MRSARSPAVVALAVLVVGAPVPLGPAKAQKAGGDSVQIAGRTAQCKGVRIVTDSRLPSEGAAGPGTLMLNPNLLNRLPGPVRLFVFSHECGHHHVGGSELGADCWAVERGVGEGWLDTKALGQVCRSFENAPATPTHPSGAKRCRNLDKCFATAVAALEARKAVASAHSSVPSTTVANAAPRLVSGPTLLATGTVRYSWDAAPCRGTNGAPAQGKSSKPGGC